MNRPIYRFDQLFEKMPNGQYRERDKPAPPLDPFHRHDYFWSPTTGRLCVMYPAISWDDAIRRGIVTFIDDPKPLLGGNWGHGALINSLGWTWGAGQPDVISSGLRWR